MSGFVRCADCKRPCGAKPPAILPTTLAAATPIRRFAANILSGKTLENAVLAALQMQIALVDRLAEEIERINNAPVINRESTDYPIP